MRDFQLSSLQGSLLLPPSLSRQLSVVGFVIELASSLWLCLMMPILPKRKRKMQRRAI
jgi:hypothetical protein